MCVYEWLSQKVYHRSETGRTGIVTDQRVLPRSWAWEKSGGKENKRLFSGQLVINWTPDRIQLVGGLTLSWPVKQLVQHKSLAWDPYARLAAPTTYQTTLLCSWKHAACFFLLSSCLLHYFIDIYQILRLLKRAELNWLLTQSSGGLKAASSLSGWADSSSIPSSCRWRS